LSSKKGLNCPFFYLFPQIFPHTVNFIDIDYLSKGLLTYYGLTYSL